MDRSLENRHNSNFKLETPGGDNQIITYDILMQRRATLLTGVNIKTGIIIAVINNII